VTHPGNDLESRTANIRGARLKIIPGMGHDFPPALMAGIAVMIAEHCRSDHG